MYGQQKNVQKNSAMNSPICHDYIFRATIKKLLYGDPRSSLDNNVFIVKSVGTFFFLSVHAQVCCELCVYTPFLANQRYEKG